MTQVKAMSAGMTRAACSALVVVALGACSTVLETSSLWDPVEDPARGISYTLAKTIVLTRVRIEAAQARLIVCVSHEIPVMDPRHQYVMSFRNNALAADTVTVRHYPSTNILREIDVKSVDQTDEFVINLAGSIGSVAPRLTERLEDDKDCESSAYVDLAELHLDPGDGVDMRRKLKVINLSVMTYVRRMARSCRDPRIPASQKVGRAACEEYERIATDFGADRPPISMRWKHPAVPVGLPVPDCTEGFCYRPRLNHILTVDVAGVETDSQPFSLTNTSPILAMDVSRGLAITKTTKITFDPLGQPATVELQKGKEDGTDGAEAVELAKLPASVISAYFESLTNTVALINQGLSNQATLAATRTRIQQQERQPERTREISVKPRPTFAMVVSNAVAKTAATHPGEGPGQDSEPLPPDAAPNGKDDPAATGPKNGFDQLPSNEDKSVKKPATTGN